MSDPTPMIQAFAFVMLVSWGARMIYDCALTVREHGVIAND